MTHSIWWQAIPYFLSGASEVFANIGCMELFYTNVSRVVGQAGCLTVGSCRQGLCRAKAQSLAGTAATKSWPAWGQEEGDWQYPTHWYSLLMHPSHAFAALG